VALVQWGKGIAWRFESENTIEPIKKEEQENKIRTSNSL